MIKIYINLYLLFCLFVHLKLVTSLAGTIASVISYTISLNDIEASCYLTKSDTYLKESQLMHGHSHGHGSSSSSSSSYILPFTIGGFLYISLVGIVPEIVEQEDIKISSLQVISAVVGITFIYLLTQLDALLPTLFV
jgi:zinc transporter ZupT